jgi:hypothetical protein
MLNSFDEFINEARGFSAEAGAYADLGITEITARIDKYLSYNLSKGHFNFSEDIIIDDAYTEVPQEVASKFPVDRIKIMFRISSVDRNVFMSYSGHYRRNYNKAKLIRKKGELVNIEIMCKLVVPKQGGQIDRELADRYVKNVLNHEMLHAYRDYRDPNFSKRYRLGIVGDYAEKAYPFLKESSILTRFFKLLYAMTDEEIRALAGEQEEFKSMEELMQSDSYEWTTMAREYNPEEYLEAIGAQLADSKYLDIILNNFGEIFLNVYRKAAHHKTYSLDPKILSIKKSDRLLDVLYFFEDYIHSQGEKLWRKLTSKITQQGTGKLI